MKILLGTQSPVFRSTEHQFGTGVTRTTAALNDTIQRGGDRHVPL